MNAYGTGLQTTKKYRFFDCAIETPRHSFCVFSSEASIELVLQHIPPAERHLLMDATFQICPIGPFKQLLLIHIRKSHQLELMTSSMRNTFILHIILYLFYFFYLSIFFLLPS